MKKIMLIIISLVTLICYARAQDEERNKVQFGLKIGANYSNVYDVSGQDFAADYKVGLATGIFVGIPIGKYFGIRPEFLYSQKGYKSTGNVLGLAYKITHSADFLDVPILFEIKPTGYVTVVAGPQYSFLLRHSNNFSSSLLTAQEQQDFDNVNLRKNILCFTGGIDFNIQHVIIGTRVGWDLLHNNGDGTSTRPRYRNLWYQATLGLRF